MNKKLYFILLSLILFSGINLSAQSISILSPNGNEHYMRNTFAPHNITWTSTGVTNVKIEFSGDNGNTWNVITPSYTASLGWYSWTTPDVISINCIIKITSVENTSISDVSNASFNMVEKAIYFAEWTTTMGDFRAQLRGDLVPMTAQNFMNLAEKGFYSNLIFHRVIPNFMIQDGCPLGTGYGDPGYEFDDEFVPELNYNITGILGMANSGPNTNGSQYFITVAPYPSLNNGYSVFGKIVDGMDVVVNISKVPRDGNDKPLTPIYLTATIVEGTPSLNITTPVATGNYFANDAINIEWQSDFVSEVKIEYSLNNGTNWTTLTESIPSYNESFPWIIPSTLTTQGLLKITSLDNPSIYSQSSFEIREKPIQVTRFEMYNGVNPNSSNPENIVQPGKIVRMKVKIKNYYTQALNALSAQIQSTNSSFTVISGNLTFTSAAVGAEIWSNEAVEIQLSETMPVPSQYDFSISVSDANVIDVPWITKFSLPILEFNPMFFSIDDDNNVLGESNGNDDNVAQQGETIEVLPKIKNKSQKICYNVYGKLTCEAPFINIWNNIQGTPNMVYDTVIYNNLNPITAGMSSASPARDFVFDYNADQPYSFNLQLNLKGYIYEAPGTTWDVGGIFVKWGTLIPINDGFSSIKEVLNNSKNFTISPNPTKNSFKIIGKTNEKIYLEIYNINGQLIRKELTNTNSSIDCSNFKPGIYHIRCISGTKKESQKLIIF